MIRFKAPLQAPWQGLPAVDQSPLRVSPPADDSNDDNCGDDNCDDDNKDEESRQV